ncbi:MAG: ABC transporter substrate-binding protein [Bacteroidota bacterium]
MRGHSSSFFKLLWLVSIPLFVGACQISSKSESSEEAQVPQEKEERIVTIGATITEVMVDLGKADQIVATGIASLYPPEVTDSLPKVGYQRNISVEGILSANPTRVILTENAGPPPAIEQLKQSGIQLDFIKEGGSPDEGIACIRKLGEIMGEEEKASELITPIEEKLATLKEKFAKVEQRPKVLFIYARGQGLMMVGGKGSSVEPMIELAGGQNAVTEFEGFQNLTPESVIAAQPEIVLMTSRGAEGMGGEDGVWGMPGLEDTPAGKAKRLVLMDDLKLLSYGPRMGVAALELFELFHGNATGSVMAKEQAVFAAQ